MPAIDWSLPIEERLKPSEPFHQDILSKLISRRNASSEHINGRKTQWKATNNKMRMYIDLTKKAKLADGSSDQKTKEMPFDRAIVIPASYSILRVLLTQLMSIFGSRDPLIQIRGRGPEDIESSKVLESVLAYDLEEMNAFGAMYAFCQDALKFGCGIIYDSWQREHGPTVVKVPPPPGIMGQIMQQISPESMYQTKWGVIKEHNLWLPINPFDFYPDPRTPVAYPQDGEFIGHRFYRGYIYLAERSRENGGPYFNIQFMRDKVNSQGREQEDGTDLGVGGFGNNEIDEKDRGTYRLDHLQVKLIPKEWDLGPETNPQIWWFTWSNDAVIIRAHKCAYDHQSFTYSIAESDPDFHSAWNPGIVESLDGLQRYIDWMFNSHLQNLMKHLNDAMIFAPALVEELDVTNPGPGRHIRVTQLAEELLMSGGYSIDQFVHQLPVQDVTSQHLVAVNEMFQLAQRMSAANDPQMGMPTPEKRTLGEINVISASASQRLTVLARLIDTMAIAPLTKRSIANRLQFTTMEQYFRVVGDQMSEVRDPYVLADRTKIQGNFDYIPNSGIMPPDPVRNATTWAQIAESVMRFVPMVMQMGVMPSDGMIPDVNKILKESMRSLGARNIDNYYMPFKPPGPPPQPPQVTPDEQVEQQVQAGNMVPLDQMR